MTLAACSVTLAACSDPPSERCDLRPSVCRAAAFVLRSSECLPGAPAAGNNCRSTFDSTADRGCFPNPLRTAQSTVRRLPLPLGLPSPVCTLPKLHVCEIQNGLALSMRVLLLRVARPITPDDDALRSGSITELYPLLRATPPLCPASVLRRLRGLPACASPFASARQVPAFRTHASIKITPPSCRTPVEQQAGRALNPIRGTESRSRFRRRLWVFRHFISGSLAFVFLIVT